MNTRTRTSSLPVTLLAWTAGAVLLGFLMTGCNEEPPPSLYDLATSGGPQPVVSGVTPQQGLAGVTVFTIAGQNFSPTPANNLVFFDASRATILEATATQLRVRAPNLVKDTVRIKIAVAGAPLYSDPPVICRLVAAFTQVRGVSDFGEPWGAAVDTAGNIYVSISSGGIVRFAPDGTGSSWAPSGGFTKWSSLKFGNSTTLYAALGLRAIFTLTQGASPAPYIAPNSGIGNVNDFDFDAQGYIWAGGSNTSVYRVAPDKSIKSYPLDAVVRSVRVYDGYVYFAGRTRADSLEKVLRYPITGSNDLGTQEVYFNLSASSFGSGGRSVYAINFTTAGDLLLGTDKTDPIIIVRPDRSAEALYPGVFSPSVHILAWGRGTELVTVRGTASGGAVTASADVFRVNAQMSGAPYYGRP